jgi:hypothetical protein
MYGHQSCCCYPSLNRGEFAMGLLAEHVAALRRHIRGIEAAGLERERECVCVCVRSRALLRGEGSSLLLHFLMSFLRRVDVWVVMCSGKVVVLAGYRSRIWLGL